MLLALLAQAIFATSVCATPNFDRLVGHWRTEQIQPSGSAIVIELEVKGNKTFKGQAIIDGNAFWTYSGRLELTGDRLIWTYLESSMPLPENYKDIDTILSIEEQRYTYRSLKTGKINRYERSQ